MTPTAVTATFILQLVSGELHVTKGLTPEACRQAVCEARYHQSCEAQAQASKDYAEILAEERAKRELEHPQPVCRADQTICPFMDSNSVMGTSMVYARSISDISEARCVP